MARGGTRSRSRTASRQRAVFRICFFFLGECLLPPRRSSVFTRVRDFTGIGHLGAYLRWPPAQILARPSGFFSASALRVHPASTAHADGASYPRVLRGALAKGGESPPSLVDPARADRPSSARRVVPRPPRPRRRPVVPKNCVREDGAGGTTPPQAAVPDGPSPTVGTAGPIEDGHRHHHGCASRAPRRPRPRARGGVPPFRAPPPAK